MNTKTLGWLLIFLPIIGFLGWGLSGGPTTPAGDMVGGYGAYATELVGISTSQFHILLGVAAIAFGLMTACFLALRAKVLENGKSQFAYLSGFLMIIGMAATVGENASVSAAASLANEGLVPEAVSMLTLGTTVGGYGTAILALGIGFLGFSMYQNKTIHVISSSAYMLVGIYGLIGSILFFDQGLIGVYYISLVATTVATGIELARTGKD